MRRCTGTCTAECCHAARRVNGCVLDQAWMGRHCCILRNLRVLVASFWMMQLHDNFYAVFGVEKCRRVGQLTCERLGLDLNPTDTEIAVGDFARLSRDRSLQVTRSLQLFLSALLSFGACTPPITPIVISCTSAGK
jgi:hypothetical protein